MNQNEENYFIYYLCAIKQNDVFTLCDIIKLFFLIIWIKFQKSENLHI